MHFRAIVQSVIPPPRDFDSANYFTYLLGYLPIQHTLFYLRTSLSPSHRWSLVTRIQFGNFTTNWLCPDSTVYLYRNSSPAKLPGPSEYHWIHRNPELIGKWVLICMGLFGRPSVHPPRVLIDCDECVPSKFTERVPVSCHTPICTRVPDWGWKWVCRLLVKWNNGFYWNCCKFIDASTDRKITADDRAVITPESELCSHSFQWVQYNKWNILIENPGVFSSEMPFVSVTFVQYWNQSLTWN